jgi:hypothetical protein
MTLVDQIMPRVKEQAYRVRFNPTRTKQKSVA